MLAVDLLKIRQRRDRDIIRNMVDKNRLKKEGISRNTVYVRNTGEVVDTHIYGFQKRDIKASVGAD